MPSSKKLIFTREQLIAGFKRIWIYCEPHKTTLVVLLVFSILEAIFAGLLPFLMGKLVDSITSGVSYTTTAIITLWTITHISNNLINWQMGMRSAKLGAMLYSDTVIRGYSHAIDLPLSFHKKHKMGLVNSRINHAAQALEGLTSEVLADLTPQLLSIVVIFGIIFSQNYILALALLLPISIYMLISARIVPRIMHLRKKTRLEFDKAAGNAQDAILNIGPVKQTTSEAYEKKRLYKAFYLKGTLTQILRQKLSTLLGFNQQIIIVCTKLVILLTSVHYISIGELTIGQMIMFMGYVTTIFAPFTRLMRNWQRIQDGLIAVELADKILDEEKEIYEPENAPILDTLHGEVQFKGASFGYHRGQFVIHDINIHIHPGEIVALVGESGVGKSTLIDLISGYFFAKKGKVLIDGHDVKTLNLKFLRSQIAIVPQEIILFNDTIKNNIRYGNFLASEKEVMEAAQKAHAHDFIEKFPKKYNQIVGERGIKLSSGQKQRIAIARAILRNPTILVLDEPTSALDAQSEQYVTQALEELMHGRTTFIIAHRLATVRKANRILVLKNGTIAEEGTHDTLITIPQGIYRNLYELQRL